MSNPLDVDRSGDLGALGISDRNPPSEQIDQEVEEAKATAAENYVSEEPVREVQAEPEPAEDEPISELSLLAQQEPEPESKREIDEAEALRRERDEYRKKYEEALLARTAAAEAEIKARAKQPEPEEQPTDYLKNPAVQAVLRQVREENPEQYEQTLIDLATRQFDEKLSMKEKQVAAELEKIRQERLEQERKEAVRQVVSTALNEVRAEGGLLAELVDQWNDPQKRENSFIYKKMMESPQAFLSGSKQGVKDAVYALESKLRRQIQAAKRGGVPSAHPGVAASAGTGVASTRGVKMSEKPKQKTPEEEYLEMIEGAGGRSKNLGFLG